MRSSACLKNQLNYCIYLNLGQPRLQPMAKICEEKKKNLECKLNEKKGLLIERKACILLHRWAYHRHVQSSLIVVIHDITVLFFAHFFPKGIVPTSIQCIRNASFLERFDDNFSWNFIPCHHNPVCQLAEQSMLYAPGWSELMLFQCKPVGVMLAKPILERLVNGDVKRLELACHASRNYGDVYHLERAWSSRHVSGVHCKNRATGVIPCIMRLLHGVPKSSSPSPPFLGNFSSAGSVLR